MATSGKTTIKVQTQNSGGQLELVERTEQEITDQEEIGRMNAELDRIELRIKQVRGH